MSGISGGKVWVAPLMLMVALRSGRRSLMTLAMDSPVRDWRLFAVSRGVGAGWV